MTDEQTTPAPPTPARPYRGICRYCGHVVELTEPEDDGGRWHDAFGVEPCPQAPRDENDDLSDHKPDAIAYPPAESTGPVGPDPRPAAPEPAVHPEDSPGAHAAARRRWVDSALTGRSLTCGVPSGYAT